MICAPSQELLNEIRVTFEHYKGKFPNVSDKALYDRIYDGFCWLGTEGSSIPKDTIEVWDKVFSGDEAYTVFKDWDEYLKYKGEYFNHPKYLAKKKVWNHLNLIEDYLFYQTFYTLSFKGRVAIDLGYVKINLPTYSKELDALSDEELQEKIASLKAPWWYDAYEDFLKKKRKLLTVSFYLPFIGKLYLWWKVKREKHK